MRILTWVFLTPFKDVKDRVLVDEEEITAEGEDADEEQNVGASV